MDPAACPRVHVVSAESRESMGFDGEGCAGRVVVGEARQGTGERAPSGCRGRGGVKSRGFSDGEGCAWRVVVCKASQGVFVQGPAAESGGRPTRHGLSSRLDVCMCSSHSYSLSPPLFHSFTFIHCSCYVCIRCASGICMGVSQLQVHVCLCHNAHTHTMQ